MGEDIARIWFLIWCQMEDSGDCCGLLLTKSSELSWRVARHGSLQTEDDRAPMRRVARHGSPQLNQRKASNKASGKTRNTDFTVSFSFPDATRIRPRHVGTECPFAFMRPEDF